jgi:hypothetical protein
MAFWKNEGGYTQPVGPADPVSPSQRNGDARDRCERCDKPRATQADFDDPAHPPGCTCAHCSSICWSIRCAPHDWRGECLALRASADLHIHMMERARVLWQAAHPDQSDRWPDGAKNVAWLVDEIERWRSNAMAAAAGFERLREETARLRGSLAAMLPVDMPKEGS